MDGYVDTRGHHIGTRKFPRYVISRREKGATELLRISLRAGDEKALPVLSSEVLARDFLRCGDLGPEWRVSVLTAASWSRCYSGRTRT